MLPGQMIANPNAGQALLTFYQTWNRKLEIAKDTSRPRAERLAALHWIDDQTGQERIADEDLEYVIKTLDPR